MVGLQVVTAASAGQDVLQCFWDLAEVDAVARMAAATSLMEHVKGEQAGSTLPPFAAEDIERSSGGGSRMDTILAGCTPSTVYILKRLVRGLASGRAAARQGFSISLAACLESIPGFGLARGRAMLDACLETSRSMKGNEVRDILIGRVFGMGAIVRGGLVGSGAEAAEVAEEVAALANKKSFLAEAVAMVLLELCESMSAADTSAMLEGAPAVRAWLEADPATASPESLLLALRLWAAMPVAVVNKCKLLPSSATPPPGGFFEGVGSGFGASAASAFFTRDHLTAVQHAMLASHSAHPRLHLLWPTLMALLIPAFKVKKGDRVTKAGAVKSSSGAEAPIGPGQLEALWEVVVEGGLFAGGSHERKALGFKLFGLLLPHLQQCHVAAVFSPAFLQCLAINLKTPDAYLHPAAKRTMERLVELVKADEAGDAEVKMAIVTVLQKFGGAGFDRVTKTKTVSQLLTGLDAEGVDTYVAELQAKFLACDPSTVPAPKLKSGEEDKDEEEEDGGEARSESRRQDEHRRWLVDQMCSAVHLPSATARTRLSVLTFLATHSLLMPKKAVKVKALLGGEVISTVVKVPAVAVSDVVRELCSARLLSSASSGGKSAAAGGGGKEGGDLLSAVCGFVAKAQQAGVPLAGDNSSESALATSLLKEAGDLEAQAAQGGPLPLYAAQQARQLAVLHRYLYLYVLCSGLLNGGATPLEGAVEDLVTAGRMALAHAKAGGGPSGAGDAAPGKGIEPAWRHTLTLMTDVEANWSYVLLDCLLLLVRAVWEPLPSAPLRDAAEGVFRSFCEVVTWNSFTHLLRLLIASEDEAAEASSDGEEDGGSDGDMDEEEESEMEEESEEDKEGDKSDEDEGGSAKDSDDDDEELPDMDDEAMFRLDGVMAAQLRGLADAKAARKAEAEAALNFKLRVAGLMEAYIKRVPGGEILPEAGLHLYSALAKGEAGLGGGKAGSAVLRQRCAKLVRLVAGSRAEAAGAAREAGSCATEAEGARTVGRLCARQQDRELLELGQSLILYLWRVALAPKRKSGGEEEAEGYCAAAPGKVVTHAADLLALFMGNKKCRLKRKLFEQAGAVHEALRLELATLALRYAVSARSGQLQVEAMQLLTALLRVPKDKQSDEVKAALGKAMKKGLPSVVQHSVCAVWSSPKLQAEAVKQAAAAVRAATALGVVDAKTLVSGKAGKQLSSRASEEGGTTGKLAGCLRNLLTLLALQPPADSEKKKDKKKAKRKADSDSEDAGEDAVMSDDGSSEASRSEEEEEAVVGGKRGKKRAGGGKKRRG